MKFTISADQRIIPKVSLSKDGYLNIARDLETIMEHKDDGDTHCFYRTWNNHQRLVDGAEYLEIKRQVETI